MALFLITGMSGAGKTSVMDGVRNGMRHKLSECVSHTTRPKRDGEEDGKAYYFIDETTFQRGLDGGEFAETVIYDGYGYGIAKDEIKHRQAETTHAYIIVNYEGYKQVKEVFPDAIGIFLYTSKEDCMINMLSRGDNLDKANKRIELYDDELKNRNDYDYVIKNVRNKITGTMSIIENIIWQYN
ncbi:putative guanylate kinase [Bacillus phage pW2]|uniref:Putative guanylate kinase n=1 Tax=Bacillus phage pW2 TaxID=2500559 RepID=A0A3T0IHG2_9CAUD|nr:guanylate kinase [Bacillus phage pW2]AZU98873.1 putative guanylate kinase [Bacillus phage pW2]